MMNIWWGIFFCHTFEDCFDIWGGMMYSLIENAVIGGYFHTTGVLGFTVKVVLISGILNGKFLMVEYTYAH